jgi:predicted ATPase/class 3 adenylate cyclase
LNNSLPTGTVTFLFTDIQGSTPLWEHEPEKMAAALQVHNTALQEAIAAQGGVVFKTVGDEFQAAFPTAPQALRAAIESQRALDSATWNELDPLKVRMGLHTGEAELGPGGDEYAVSHTKNRAARIMSAAHGGQILISQETSDLVDHQLPNGVMLKDLGEHRLKGIEILEHLFQVCAPDLAQDFPPLATTISHPHNLPLQLTSFIGREREVAEVSALLEKHRLVTLTGSGGTGKTRLSLRAAEEVLDLFPNGVWFAELAGLADPELVPRTIVAALGLQESPNRSLLDQLKDYLRDKQLLIVLDNCEHVIADCARIADALLRACPRLKILASSREALSVAGEVAYHVPSLSAPDPHALPPLEAFSHFAAVQLFAERAAAVNPGFQVTDANAQAVAQVCRRLDGIPLAIELAAARVGALSVAQIAERLDNRFRLLTGGSRTALPRQQTLRASIDWSYSLLDASERLLLMRLSVFQGGWTLELASEVCGFDGLDEFDVLDGLTQLVNKSLIIAETGANGSNRYRRLETIRQYAREKLLDSGASEAVRDRHLEAFTRLAEAAEPHLRGQRGVEWLDRLEVELDNLRAALEWALEGDALQGLRLVTTSYWLWHSRGYRVEGEAWLRQLQERLGEQADIDLALMATARARQAVLQAMTGRRGGQVARLAREALELAEQLGEDGKPIQAIALYTLAGSARVLGQEAITYRFARQCLEIAEALGDRFMVAESYLQLTWSDPDPIKARNYAEKHLALRRELGDVSGLVIAHVQLVVHHFWSGDLAQAHLLLKEAMEIASKLKDRAGLMVGQVLLGYFSYAGGEADKAIEHFFQALAIGRDLGEQGHVIRQLNALGCAYGAKKEWSQAERYFQQAIATARANRFVLWEITSCIHLAEVASTFGDVELAVQYYEAAGDIDRSQEEAFVEGLIAYGAGKAALLRGDLRAADVSFRQALREVAETGSRIELKYDLEALAVCAAQAGQVERAVRLYGMVASRQWMLWPGSMPWLISYDLDAMLAPARATLGEAEYARLYAEGQAMTLDQTLAYALEIDDE